MLYAPVIRNYRPFYIQWAYDAVAKDTIAAPYYIVVKSPEYPPYKVKEPYKNQWFDEHGDDEYISGNGLWVEAFTLKVECAMYAFGSASGDTIASLISNLNQRMQDFHEYLRAGWLKIYDTSKAMGFQNVRLVEFPTPSEDAYKINDNAKQIIGRSVKLRFSFTLKVNDPVTRMVMQDGAIVEPTEPEES